MFGEAEFSKRIDQLDAALLVIESQTTQRDRATLLRIQRLVRSRFRGYTYVEIGSHLGGTLVPPLMDPLCKFAVSIDPRPTEQADVRGRSFYYADNSTERMIHALQKIVAPTSLEKLRTFDLDASSVSRADLPPSADLLLIDGEHTIAAAFSDFISLFPILARDAVITFHDANLVAEAIRNVERFLMFMRIPFETMFLPDAVAAIGLRDMAPILAEDMRPHIIDRAEYLSQSRQFVWSSIVSEAVARGDVEPADSLCDLRQKVAVLESREQTLLREQEALRAYAKQEAELRLNSEWRLDAIRRSTIWRVTAPVRRVISLLRG